MLRARIDGSRNHLPGSDQKDYIIDLAQPPEVIEKQSEKLPSRFQEIGNSENEINMENEIKEKKIKKVQLARTIL